MVSNGVFPAHSASQNGKKEFAVQLYWPDEDAGAPSTSTDAWSDIVPVSSINFDDCGNKCVFPVDSRHCPSNETESSVGVSIKRVVNMAPHLVKTRWMKRQEKIDYWSDEVGRLVLIGEAAHPWFVSAGFCSSFA